MSDWVDCQLGDLANFRNGKTSPNREIGGSIPVYGSNGIIGCSDQSNTKPNTSIIGRVGSYCGSVYYSQSACWVTDNAIVGEPREEKADGKFLYYLLKRLNLNNVAHGSGQPLLNQSVLNGVELLAPPTVDEQQAIAEILSSLDEKIELNCKQNRTLEAIAQMLFKRWFVEFEFPDENGQPYKSSGGAMQPSELGEIPVGWEVGCIDDVCCRIFSGGTPHTKTNEYWNGAVPWLSSGETRQRFILRTDKTITQSGVKNSSTRLARAGSVVIASAGQGKTRGQTSYLGLDSYINQSVISLEADLELISDNYLFYNLAPRYEELRQLSDSHSIRGSLTTKILAQISTIIPPKRLVEEFDRTAYQSIEKIIVNEKESHTLANLRDTLLPKLISGELRVA